MTAEPVVASYPAPLAGIVLGTALLGFGLLVNEASLPVLGVPLAFLGGALAVCAVVAQGVCWGLAFHEERFR